MEQRWYRFDEAINPYGCSPKAAEAMAAFARSRTYRFYGEPDGESLREHLAHRFGLSPDHFLVYNGAGEAVAWVYVLCLLIQQRRLIVPYPSYERFVDGAKLCARQVIEVPLAPVDFSLDVQLMIDEARAQRATLGLLSNPNSPNGNHLVDDRAMAELLDALPDCLWIVDEAFADYGGRTFLPWVRERPNLIVVRTFSKAYGLAGLRIGYAAAHQSILEQLSKFHIPWGVDSMALVGATAALEDDDYLMSTLATIRRDVATLRTSLERFPNFHIYPSVTNFLYIRLSDVDPESLKDDLLARRIRVRSRPDFPQHIRITSLLPDDNAHLVETLTTHLGAARV